MSKSRGIPFFLGSIIALLALAGGLSISVAFGQVDPSRPLPPTIRLNVVEASYFSKWEKQRLERVIPLVERILSSVEFRDAVLDFVYNGKKQFYQSGGLTNAEVYSKLMEGDEWYAPGSLQTVDVYLSMYYSKKNVVGYTNPSTRTIYINNKYYTYSDETWWTDASVAANIIHEWTHKLGFDHAFNYSWSRDFTVPYGIQGIVAKLGEKFLKEQP